MKKIVISIGAISAVLAPVAFAISCNSKADEPDVLKGNFDTDTQTEVVTTLDALKSSIIDRLDSLSELFDGVTSKGSAQYALFKNRGSLKANDNYYFISLGSAFSGVDPKKVTAIDSLLTPLNSELAKLELIIVDEPQNVSGSYAGKAPDIKLSEGQGQNGVHFKPNTMKVEKVANSNGEQFVVSSGLTLNQSPQPGKADDFYVKASAIEAFGNSAFEQVNICLSFNKADSAMAQNFQSIVQSISNIKESIEKL